MKEIMEQYGSVLIATVVCIGVLGLLCQVPFAGRKGLFSGVGVYIEKQMDHAEKENIVFDSYWRKNEEHTTGNNRKSYFAEYHMYLSGAIEVQCLR